MAAPPATVNQITARVGKNDSCLPPAALAAIRRWYRQPGAGEAARRRLRAILAAIETLTEAPCRYRTDDHPGMRRMVIERHVIIYRVDRGTGDSATAGDVQVLRVFSPGQQQEP